MKIVSKKFGSPVAHTVRAGIRHLRDTHPDRWIFEVETNDHRNLEDSDVKELMTALRRRANSIAKFIFKNPNVVPFRSQEQGIEVGIEAVRSGKSSRLQGYYFIMFDWLDSNASAKRFGDVLAQRAYKD